jgi:hypothetical protein
MNTTEHTEWTIQAERDFAFTGTYQEARAWAHAWAAGATIIRA